MYSFYDTKESDPIQCPHIPTSLIKYAFILAKSDFVSCCESPCRPHSLFQSVPPSQLYCLSIFFLISFSLWCFALACVSECSCASCTLIGAKHQFWQGGSHIRPLLCVCVCTHTRICAHTCIERARASQLVILDAAGSLSSVLCQAGWLNLGPELVCFQLKAQWPATAPLSLSFCLFCTSAQASPYEAYVKVLTPVGGCCVKQSLLVGNEEIYVL